MDDSIIALLAALLPIVLNRWDETRRQRQRDREHSTPSTAPDSAPVPQSIAAELKQLRERTSHLQDSQEAETALILLLLLDTMRAVHSHAHGFCLLHQDLARQGIQTYLSPERTEHHRQVAAQAVEHLRDAEEQILKRFPQFQGHQDGQDSQSSP